MRSAILIIVVILLIGGVPVWFYVHSISSQPAPTAQSGQPDIKVTDLSGGVPDSQKTAVMVEHSDSSYEKFILSNAMVDGYVQHLPPGDKVISKTPLSN